jgi:competence protein ComEC
MTRKAIWFGVFWLFGIAVTLFLQIVILVFIGAAIFAASVIGYILSYKKVRLKIVIMLFCFSAFGLGMTFAGMYCELRYNAVMQYENAVMPVTGIVTDMTGYGDRASYVVDGKINNLTPAVITVFTDNIADIGDKVTVTGKLEKPDNTYAFNSENYYRNKGIYLRVSFPESFEVDTGSNNLITKFSNSYREKLYKIIHKAIPNVSDASLFIAMLFGDRDGITSAQTDRINNAGIAHIMAVSGAQLAIICTALMFILSGFGVGKRISFFIMLIPLALFLLLAEDAVSIRRAAIMIVITYSGNLFSKRADTANSLAIACVILTAVNPFTLFDASFLLSSGGVFALAVVTPAVTGNRIKTAADIRQERKNKDSSAKENSDSEREKPVIKLLSAGKDVVIASAVINLTLLPVCFLFFDGVSLIGIITNLFMIPLSTVVLILGMAVVLTGGISFFAYPLLFLCGLLCKIAWVITDFFARFDFAYIPMGYSFETPLLILLGIAVAITLLIVRGIKLKVTAFIAAVCIFCLTVSIYRIIPTDKLQMVTVGDEEASAYVINDRFNAAVIDLSGNGDAAVSVKRYLNRLGIKNISAVVLTKKPNLSYPVYKNAFANVDTKVFLMPDLEYSVGDAYSYRDEDFFPIIKDVEFSAHGEKIFIRTADTTTLITGGDEIGGS